MDYTYIAVLLVNIAIKADSAKILAVFPTPSISHQVVFRPLTHELARRGNDVTVITPDPTFPKGQSPANLTEIDVHHISYKTWQEELSGIAVGNNIDMLEQLKMFTRLGSIILREQILTKEVQELIKKETHFDLILLEAWVRPALIFSHIYKAPIIQISSLGAYMGNNKIIGTSSHPMLYPLIFRQRLYNLTFLEKIQGTYDQLYFEIMHKSFEEQENRMVKQLFWPDIPTLSELGDNVDMVFLNVHPIWYDNQPMPPNVVFMGGLHQTPEKELPRDLKSYLDSSKHGVIYISFGTNVQSSVLPLQKIKMMMNVFAQLPYDVIWKWDTELEDVPKNIKLYKWLPQADLLRHPKLILFVTQGGLQSTDEAITAGVPLIGIPIMADQFYNTEKYVKHGIGIQLGIDAFTAEEFKNAIVTVIEDKSYKNNMIKLRSLILDQPQKPLERAIWWIEHVLRHGGGRHLRAPAANMSWTEYYEVNLILILVSCLVAALISTVLAVSCLTKVVMNALFSKAKVKKS